MIKKNLWIVGLICLIGASFAMHGAALDAVKKEAPILFKEQSDSEVKAAVQQAETREQRIRRGYIAMGINSTIAEPISSLSYDEHELEKLAEWEADIEPLDVSIMNSVLSENMKSDRFDPIEQLIEEWEKTPGEDEYDFETDAQAEAACNRLTRYSILLGTPGSDKKMLAQAIAQKCKMKIFSKDALLIANSRDLENVFRYAKASGKKCAIIVDEIDSLFAHHNIINTLCWLLDNYEDKPILFIGTANNVSAAPVGIRSRFEGDSIIPTAAYMTDKKQLANQWKVPAIVSITLAIAYLGYKYYYKQGPAALA